MADWHVQHGGRVREFSDDKLRRALRKGKMSGSEMVRRGADEAWSPLHSLDVFSQEVPHSGSSVAVVQQRLWTPFVLHLAAFAGVMTVMSLDGSPPGWGAWWAFGLFMHLVVVGMRSYRARSQARGASPVVQTVAEAAKSAPSPLLRALDRLEDAVQGQPERLDDGQLQELRSTARDIGVRRTRLHRITDGQAIDELKVEMALATERAEQATDDRSREVFEQEWAAIEHRLAIVDDARRESERLAARERTLVHQIEGLCLALSKEDTTSADLGDQVRLLREEMTAEAEVDEALARSRRAARAKGLRAR